MLKSSKPVSDPVTVSSVSGGVRALKLKAVNPKTSSSFSSSSSSSSPPVSVSPSSSPFPKPPVINARKSSSLSVNNSSSNSSSASSSVGHSRGGSTSSLNTSGTASPVLSAITRRKLSVPDRHKADKEKEEQKSLSNQPSSSSADKGPNASSAFPLPPSASPSSAPSVATQGKTAAIRRRLSVMSPTHDHMDGVPDPKETREAKIKLARAIHRDSLSNNNPTHTNTNTTNTTTALPPIARGIGATTATGDVSSLTPLTPNTNNLNHHNHNHTHRPIKPRRVFSHYASLSKVGYIPFNPYKVNQDRAVEIVRFHNRDDCALFGVFDGHGSLGHEVSSFLVTEIPKQLAKHTQALVTTASPSPPPLPPPTGTSITATVNSEMHQSIIKAFLDTNTALASSSHIDCTFSGSTGIVCYLQGRRLYSCNVGDSRAVLGRMECSTTPSPTNGTTTTTTTANGTTTAANTATDSQEHYIAIPLSSDHKPDRIDEKKRILDCKGRVASCKGVNGEDVGPTRVWLAHQDVPGLAMTRSFGDLIAASVGVIARPEVWEREVTDDDRFLVLGSDGIFEFLSNEEVVEIVGRVGGRSGECAEEAAKALVTAATKRWNEEEEVCDDITAIIVYF